MESVFAVLLTEINGVSSKTAELLSNNGYKIAESVAYAPIYDVTCIEGVNATVYKNAQRLVEQQSNGDSDFLRYRTYWCRQCAKNSVVGSASFNSESTAVGHHYNCDECDPDYNI